MTAPFPRSRRVGRLRSAVVLLCAALAVAACSKEEPPIARRPPTPLDEAMTGTIRGMVRYTGAPPAETRVRVGGDPACAQATGGGVATGDAQVVDGKLGGALVYIAGGLEGRVFEIPDEPVVIDQRGCWYVPHVVGAQAGQEIEFRNSDRTLHNVHTQPKRSPAVNFGMSPQVTQRSIRIEQPEVTVKIGCDVHPWMRAFVGVLDHPYFALSGADGTFTLSGVPAGRYTVGVWHERFGARTAEVAVEPKKEARLEFEYSTE